MTATIISFSAARTARMLRDNAPPSWIDSFLVQMTSVAREERDIGREAFWCEVARLLDRDVTPLAV
ncbi:MAG TPA: hypothetical protein VLV85_14690 [Stellaceae bacterium]|nr:hypothetical protein [Stellaceae bacterium]